MRRCQQPVAWNNSANGNFTQGKKETSYSRVGGDKNMNIIIVNMSMEEKYVGVSMFSMKEVSR